MIPSVKIPAQTKWCHAGNPICATYLKDTPSPHVCSLVFTTSNGVVCVTRRQHQEIRKVRNAPILIRCMVSCSLDQPAIGQSVQYRMTVITAAGLGSRAVYFCKGDMTTRSQQVLTIQGYFCHACAQAQDPGVNWM